jgi:hypothetical protein
VVEREGAARAEASLLDVLDAQEAEVALGPLAEGAGGGAVAVEGALEVLGGALVALEVVGAGLGAGAVCVLVELLEELLAVEGGPDKEREDEDEAKEGEAQDEGDEAGGGGGLLGELHRGDVLGGVDARGDAALADVGELLVERGVSELCAEVGAGGDVGALEGRVGAAARRVRGGARGGRVVSGAGRRGDDDGRWWWDGVGLDGDGLDHLRLGGDGAAQGGHLGAVEVLGGGVAGLIRVAGARGGGDGRRGAWRGGLEGGLFGLVEEEVVCVGGWRGGVGAQDEELQGAVHLIEEGDVFVVEVDLDGGGLVGAGLACAPALHLGVGGADGLAGDVLEGAGGGVFFGAAPGEARGAGVRDARASRVADGPAEGLGGGVVQWDSGAGVVVAGLDPGDGGVIVKEDGEVHRDARGGEVVGDEHRDGVGRGRRALAREAHLEVGDALRVAPRLLRAQQHLLRAVALAAAQERLGEEQERVRAVRVDAEDLDELGDGGLGAARVEEDACEREAELGALSGGHVGDAELGAEHAHGLLEAPGAGGLQRGADEARDAHRRLRGGIAQGVAGAHRSCWPLR